MTEAATETAAKPRSVKGISRPVISYWFSRCIVFILVLMKA